MRRHRINECDREDLFQSVALKAWAAYPSFRGESQFSTWLYALSQNVISNWTRLVRHKYEVLGGLPDVAGDSYRRIKPVLTSLSKLELRTFSLYADGYSYQEMEEIMGEPASRLRVRINRIRKELKRYN